MKPLWVLIWWCFLLILPSAFALPMQVSPHMPPGFSLPTELRVVKVKRAPQIDGRVDTVWSQARPVTVYLRGGSGEIPLTLRAIYTEEQIFFLAEWPDSTEDRTHKPWVWDEGRQR
ncbi:MAG: hypothetical protein D6736_15900 [Nitrospinota bacterium]|nr:MAG: hypothetical protein D6736_15900 [Nitrospinota bacterium]